MNKLIAVFLILSSLLCGCSVYEQAVKAPQLEQVGKNVHDTLTGLELYYEQKDINNFFKSVSKAYNRKYEKFYGSLQRDFDNFNNIKISIAVDRMALNKNLIDVETHWTQSYELKQTGEFVKRQGKTSFVFTNSSRPRLIDATGDVLFGLNK